MYFEDSDKEITVNAPMDMKLVLSINGVLILAVGLFPDFWMNVLAGLRLGLKNRQMGEKWVFDDCSYLCKGLKLQFFPRFSFIMKIMQRSQLNYE
jgi:hypothetical protein